MTLLTVLGQVLGSQGLLVALQILRVTPHGVAQEGFLGERVEESGRLGMARAEAQY